MASSSGPDRPSTWQLLFGKKSHVNGDATTNQGDLNRGDTRLPSSHAKPSPSKISDQLLRSLNTRRAPSSEDEIGRECSEELLGRPNAFTQRLHLHIASHPDHDAKVRAKEIIAARFRVEAQADAIRKGQRDKVDRINTRTAAQHVGKPRPEPSQPVAQRHEKVRELQRRREEQQHQLINRMSTIHQGSKPTAAAGISTSQHSSRAGISKPSRVRKEPHVHVTARAHGDQKRGKVHLDEHTNSSVRGQKHPNNQDDGEVLEPVHRVKQQSKQRKTGPEEPPVDEVRALRRLEGKLRALENENQKAVDLEERLQRKRYELQIKRRVWAVWIDRVEMRRRQELGVLRAQQWRLLQRLWIAWRNFARNCKSQRVAEEERRQFVRQKEQEEMAGRFFRKHHLARWFHQWRCIANAQRDATAFEREMIRRREKASRLMDRYKQTSKEEETQRLSEQAATQGAGEQYEKEKPQSDASRSSTMARKPLHSKRITKEAWTAEPVAPKTEAPTLATMFKPAPSPDAFYVSMQERALQRKERREQLRKKYDKLEQEKKEALERQVAERELLLAQRKEEEREAVRERRREETRLAREKEAKRQIAIVMNQSADLHNHLRLLYHYGWRSWQEQWLTRRRVASNASKWHALRVLYRTWTAWKEVIELKKQAQEQRERAQEMQAAEIHKFRMIRKTMKAWRSVREATHHKELALHRQTRWYELRTSWRRWQLAYASTVGIQSKREQDARSRLGRLMLCRVLHAWHKAIEESRKERQRLREKEALLKKARMWLDS